MEVELWHLGFLQTFKGPKICDQFNGFGQLVCFTNDSSAISATTASECLLVYKL